MKWTFAGAFVAAPKLKLQTGNLLRLREDRVDRIVRDAFIGRLEVPGFDALQILLEAFGEAKRLCCELRPRSARRRAIPALS